MRRIVAAVDRRIDFVDDEDGQKSDVVDRVFVSTLLTNPVKRRECFVSSDFIDDFKKLLGPFVTSGDEFPSECVALGKLMFYSSQSKLTHFDKRFSDQVLVEVGRSPQGEGTVLTRRISILPDRPLSSGGNWGI